VAVLHQGRVIKTVNQTAHCRQELSRISRVLYREDDQRYQTKKHQGEPVLSITGLEAGLREPLSFGLNRGEFVVMVTPKVELFQILQCRVLEGEQEKNCILSYHGKAVRRLSRQRGVIFLDGTHLDDLIEELSPLENLCIGIYDKAGRFGLENRNIMRCMEQDFYDWYGHDGMLRGKNCRSLYRKDRVAINLFKLNFLNPQIIFCNDLSIHNDIINYHFVKETIAKLTERGTTVCMITGDLMYNDELVDRYVVLYDEYD
jgi:ABC-type sugar transport system ATPase subunit